VYNIIFWCVRTWLVGLFENTQLSENTTFATWLKADDGSYDNQPRRIRIEKTLLPLPTLTVNFYAKVVQSDQRAVNGWIHTVDHPLVPPPSIIDELFLYPGKFATLTSALQKVDLDDTLQFRYHFEDKFDKGKYEGDGPTVTLFAPSNDAFEELPTRLRLWLFSPFGSRALKKLLQFHIVPEHIVHVDWIHNATSSESTEVSALTDTFVRLPTALFNHTLPVHIEKSGPTIPIPGNPPSTSFTVKGEQVSIVDGVARNGAIHVVDALLDPRPGHHYGFEGGKSTWDDWEEWLPEWSKE